MSFRINTNVNAMNSHANAVGNNRNLANSLGRLSSGLRIQTAADDASGLAIADSLRSQASALGQAIANGNDAIGIIQVADKAMDEQLKILDTIKVKATQAAQDGQTTRSRQALQADIVRLMEELDNIGNSTSFNGQQLLNGTFSNKEFQIGAYSNQTVKASIGATTSDKIGLTRFESSKFITAGGNVSLTFINVDGINNVKVAGTVISTGLGTGLGALAENINKVADQTGVRATFDVTWKGKTAIAEGNLQELKINGVTIGDLQIKANDSNGTLVNAINAVKDQTGVEASIDPQGKLVLTSRDGRAMEVTSKKDNTTPANNISTVFGYGDTGENMNKLGAALSKIFIGRLNLVRLDGRDIKISSGEKGNANGAFSTAFSQAKTAKSNGGAEASVSLREIKGQIDAKVAAAMGFQRMANSGAMSSNQAAGVMTLRGAMAVMDIAESAQRTLDFIRSDLGSVQNQLVATVNNITVTQVNVKSAESQIRDVDFAAESANFSKYNILAQSGSYAMSQANSVQQNVLKLLQ
ncbi:flagellin [Campylobacter pinnipediorum subsp. caledonicus]|uniref:flagellin B n=3 Tax=Campylobacter pinnipediorum TaxID=1965231 RepID=UPI0009956315|nr:flagellin B [Campylobacter pinnipediorum]AQW86810.1 flagellin [Campylobacter pinnipediorum subsp. caledonicus]